MKVLALACLGLIVSLASANPGSGDQIGEFSERVLSLVAKVRDLTQRTVGFRQQYERLVAQSGNRGSGNSGGSNNFADYILDLIGEVENNVGGLQGDASYISDYLQQSRDSYAASGNPGLVAFSTLDASAKLGQFASGIADLKRELLSFRDESLRLREVYELYQRLSDQPQAVGAFGTEAVDQVYTSVLNDVNTQVTFLRISGTRFLRFLETLEEQQ